MKQKLLVLLSCILINTQPLHAKKDIVTPFATAGATFCLLSCYDMYLEDEDALFYRPLLIRRLLISLFAGSIARYLTKQSALIYIKKGDPKKILEIEKILTKKYWQNILHVIDDYWIGQRPEYNRFKISQNADKKVKVDVGIQRPAKGIYGTLEARLWALLAKIW